MGFILEETLARLSPFEEERMAVQDLFSEWGYLKRRPVLVHPGSGGLRKIWPLDRWWALLKGLLDCGRPVLMTLGPADSPLREFASKAEEQGVVVLEKLSLPRLAAFLAESSSFVGGDSGVSHLASVMGTPTLVIFGPTNPLVWAPPGPNVRVVRDFWDEAEIMPRRPEAAPAAIVADMLAVLENLAVSDGR
jgi:ADP-heptose:LPS heptosyltransferase